MKCGWVALAPCMKIPRRHAIADSGRCLKLRTPPSKPRTAGALQPQNASLLSIQTSTCTRTNQPYPAMWDDEDNNPYGSFARHDSNTSDVTGLASPTACKAQDALQSSGRALSLPYRSTLPTGDAAFRDIVPRAAVARVCLAKGHERCRLRRGPAKRRAYCTQKGRLRCACGAMAVREPRTAHPHHRGREGQCQLHTIHHQLRRKKHLTGSKKRG